MHGRHIAGALACLLCLNGCVVQRSFMAGTEMNLADYSQRKVGVLPVSVNPPYDSRQLPLEGIRSAVLKRFNEITRVNAVAVTPDNPEGLPFPLTPQRLSEIARRLGLDAAIGISIASWGPPYEGHRSRTSVTIAFADAADPEGRKWVMSGLWKAWSLDRIPAAMETGLDTQFINLKRLLTSGSLLPWTAAHGLPSDPILMFDSPGRSTPRVPGTVPDKAISLTVMGIDDRGLAELKVMNKSADFSWKPAPEVMEEKPIFLNAAVSVPLAAGPNRIKISAVNTAGHRVERKIRLRSTAPRGVMLLAFGIEQYGDHQLAKGAQVAAAQVARAGSRLPTPPLLLTNANVTERKVIDALEATRATAGLGDEMLVLIAGRGGVARQRPYLFTHTDEENWAPPRLYIDDVIQSAGRTPLYIILDLCTDASFLETARRQLWGAIDRLASANADRGVQIVGELSDCEQGVGVLARTLTTWLSTGRPSRSEKRIGIGSLFARLSTERVEFSEFFEELNTSKQVMYSAAAQTAQQPEERLFHAVATSTPDRAEAETMATELKAAQYASEIILGTNGIFHVTFGSSSTYDGAAKIISGARSNGDVYKNAYVLDPAKVMRQDEAIN